MFSKILYPTDFSDASMKALAYIKQLKEAGAKEVLVLHVIDERQIDGVCRLYASRGSAAIVQASKEQAWKKSTLIGDKIREMGLDVRQRIETGIPLKEILRAEKEENVSLIIMGSHGKSNVQEMLLGSVSEKVMRKSTKPVLLIKR